jgi:hypothetical protein
LKMQAAQRPFFCGKAAAEKFLARQAFHGSKK